MKVFDAHVTLESHLKSEELRLKMEIKAEGEDRLLTADEAQYEDYFFNRFRLDTPTFRWKDKQASRSPKGTSLDGIRPTG